MAASAEECILTDDGYKTIKHKYESDIAAFIEDMRRQSEEENKIREESTPLEEDFGIPIPDYIDLSIPDGEDMPF